MFYKGLAAGHSMQQRASKPLGLLEYAMVNWGYKIAKLVESKGRAHHVKILRMHITQCCRATRVVHLCQRSRDARPKIFRTLSRW